MNREQRYQRDLNVAADLKAGEPDADVMQKYSIGYRTLLTICKRFNILRTGSRYYVTHAYHALFYLLNSSLTYQQIGEKVGVTKARIQQLAKIAREYGFEITRD